DRAGRERAQPAHLDRPPPRHRRHRRRRPRRQDGADAGQRGVVAAWAWRRAAAFGTARFPLAGMPRVPDYNVDHVHLKGAVSMLFALAPNNTYHPIAGGTWLKRPPTIAPAAVMMKPYPPAAAPQTNAAQPAPTGVADRPPRLPTLVSLESKRSP